MFIGISIMPLRRSLVVSCCDCGGAKRRRHLFAVVVLLSFSARRLCCCFFFFFRGRTKFVPWDVPNLEGWDFFIGTAMLTIASLIFCDFFLAGIVMVVVVVVVVMLGVRSPTLVVKDVE